jgi:hypothetical protein
MSNSIIDNQRDQEIMKKPEREITLVEMLLKSLSAGFEHQEKVYREYLKSLKK